MMRGRTMAGTTGALLVAVAALATTGAAGAQSEAPACAAGDDPVVLTGELPESAAETYTLLPVDVAEGTTRVEVGYEWEDVVPEGDTRSVLDLGMWDADGTSGPEAFRGWSGRGPDRQRPGPGVHHRRRC